MLLNANQSGENFEDSGFLNPDVSSDAADSDYTEVNVAGMDESNNNLPNAIAAVPTNSHQKEDDKAAEHHKRLMSRTPQ